MEYVRGRWVVYNDNFAELSAQSAEVFDIVSSVENTGFPEEPGSEHAPLVQQVGHGVSVLNPDKHSRLMQATDSTVCERQSECGDENTNLG